MAPSPNNEYLPWIWRIFPTTLSNHKCPTAASILLTYLAVNGLTSLLGIGLSHRIIVRRISFGLLGTDGSTSWKWMWIVQLGLHFGADLIVAYITTHAAGYDHTHTPKIWDLALFYASRPRMAWLLLGSLGEYQLQMRTSSRTSAARAEEKQEDRLGSPAASQPGSRRSEASSVDSEDGDKIEMVPPARLALDASNGSTSAAHLQDATPLETTEDELRLDAAQGNGPIEGHWTSAAKQTLIAEAIMQIVGSYYLGRTAHFATTHGYYQPDAHYDSNARLMYGGALFTLITSYITLLGVFIELCQLTTRKPLFLTFLNITIGEGFEWVPNAAFTFGYVTYIGTWLFWSGYVKLAGQLYCPPNLFYQGVVWVSMNVLGIVLGAGF